MRPTVRSGSQSVDGQQMQAQLKRLRLPTATAVMIDRLMNTAMFCVEADERRVEALHPAMADMSSSDYDQREARPAMTPLHAYVREAKITLLCADRRNFSWRRVTGKEVWRWKGYRRLCA